MLSPYRGGVKLRSGSSTDDKPRCYQNDDYDSEVDYRRKNDNNCLNAIGQTSAGRQQTGSGLGLMICVLTIKNMVYWSLESPSRHRNDIYDHNPGSHSTSGG